MLAKYAEVAIKVGVGLEQGDRLLIKSSVEAVPLTRVLVEQAYAAGAVNVDVLWNDDSVSVARFSHGGGEAARVVSSVAAANLAAFDMGDHFLTVIAGDPNAMAGQDVTKIGEFQRTNARYLERMAAAFGRYERQWSIIAAPTPAWARSVFPDADQPQAVEKLWEAIFRACRVDSADPVVAWREHLAGLISRRDHLTARNYRELRYDGPGTDLRLGLPAETTWQGGNVVSLEGRLFGPNIPTEEVFASPHLAMAEGVVTATKPLSLFGIIVEGLRLELSGGEIVASEASAGQEVVDQLLATDEGSRRLGEAAMVPMSSAVAAEGLVWNNTLFDENDGCHIAIGRAYPATVEGGSDLDRDAQTKVGLNYSNVHVDFVVGSREMDVFGVGEDGAEEPIILGGEWGF